MGNKVREQVQKSQRNTLTKARCSKANGNRQHAVDVTVTACRCFFDKLCPPSRFKNNPLIT
jgi:hypothetical protein